MRGEDRTSGALFSYVDVEARIPAKHPLRAMRRLTDAALAELDLGFSALYERIGRPSIPPERLLRASLLQLLLPVASTTDKDARLDRKGAEQESRLAYLGHVLMENHGRARRGGPSDAGDRSG